MAAMSAHSILEQLFDPFIECLSRSAAEKILSFRVDSETQSRVNSLREKSSAGTLTEAERTEYRELIDAFDLVAIMKSKARIVSNRAV